jgi:hypothetical protein
LAEALLKYETLDKGEIEKVIAGEGLEDKDRVLEMERREKEERERREREEKDKGGKKVVPAVQTKKKNPLLKQ